MRTMNFRICVYNSIGYYAQVLNVLGLLLITVTSKAPERRRQSSDYSKYRDSFTKL